MPRFRFGAFLVSPAHRVLRKADADVPLIPRYFDLLILLIANRHRAVTRQEIFDRVWGDVIVSDAALSQAIRTVRRALGDDPREPIFIRTVARHGYQFVCPDVIEEVDDGPLDRRPANASPPLSSDIASDAERASPSTPRQAHRWLSAAAAGAAAGTAAGALGGTALWLVQSMDTTITVVPALMIVGAASGAIGAGGIGAGLVAAEQLMPSRRLLSLVLGGAVAGGLTGGLVHIAIRAIVSGLFGRDVAAIGGAMEGLALGAAAGLGYGVAAAVLGDLEKNAARWRASAITGALCSICAFVLTLGNGHLVGSSLDVLAGVLQGADGTPPPFRQLMGRPELRPATQTIVAAFEGLLFGAGLAFGLTRRRRG